MSPTRRDFLRTYGAAIGASTVTAALGALSSKHVMAQASPVESSVKTTTSALGRDAPAWRRHFPALAQVINGHSLVYLDNAATVHRPTAVIDAIADFYRHDNGNPGQGLHALADRANDRYEAARRDLASFINAQDALEVIWVRGTTEAINLVATAWGGENLKPGDEILVSIAEHYSNLVPWQLAARRTGATLRFVDVTDDGHIRLDQLDRVLTSRTKLVSISHVSNVLGMFNPVREICERAHTVGAKVLIDGAQSIPHVPIDVRAMGCDFFALSGHKMMGPMGIGALWARREILESMPPYQAGGDMAHTVTRERISYAPGALKFEAGTPNVSGPVGLVAAIKFIQSIGHETLWAHEQTLARRAIEAFSEIDGLRILGSKEPKEKIALIAFTVADLSAAEVLRALDAEGIGVRAGELAALPLLQRFGLDAATRASFYHYNTTDEVDQLAAALRRLVSRSRMRHR